MHDCFLVHTQLCFVVSFVLWVPRLEKGVMFSGKALGQMARTLLWMPGAPGKHTLSIPPKLDTTI